MKPIVISQTITAPLDLVFETVSDIRNFRKAVSDIVRVEFLSDRQVGVGTRFLETREMKGREHSVELKLTEYIVNDRVRMISDAGGTVWDSLFTVSKDINDNTLLDLQMDIKPHKLLAKITAPLIRGFVTKGVETDLKAIKEYCESQSR